MERAFHPITRDPRSGITASSVEDEVEFFRSRSRRGRIQAWGVFSLIAFIRAFTSGLFGASAREFRGVFSRIVHPREIYRAS